MGQKPNLLFRRRLYLRKVHIDVDFLGPTGVNLIAKQKEQPEQDEGSDQEAKDHSVPGSPSFNNDHTIITSAHVTPPVFVSLGQNPAEMMMMHSPKTGASIHRAWCTLLSIRAS
jgi:hypothetical protein